jgi:UDP-N-acetylmuramoyl-tripeptide--D-alanyl-D-alanine ligase
VNTFRWTASEVSRALGVSPSAADDREFGRVSTDTRSVQPGDLFVALRGEHFDAHGFLAQAAAAGATGAVVSRVPDDAPEGLMLFRVENTLHALGALARHRRDALGGRVVGVVGSNGKTTTKDLIRAALSERFRVQATARNNNNQNAAPLTLHAPPDDEEAVVV